MVPCSSSTDTTTVTGSYPVSITSLQWDQAVISSEESGQQLLRSLIHVCLTANDLVMQPGKEQVLHTTESHERSALSEALPPQAAHGHGVYSRPHFHSFSQGWCSPDRS
ncbi:hypothetical protein AGIG_G16210 [Arapaima gigas]